MSTTEKKHKAEQTIDAPIASEGKATTNGQGVGSGAAAQAPPAPTPSGTGPAAAENLEEQLRKLKLEKEELWNQLVRRQADFENFRKRVEREVGEARQLAAAGVIEALLPVVDALDRSLAVPVEGAAEEYRKGFELIRKQLMETLERFGLKPIEALGKRFDPHYHHALERMDTAELPDHTVVAEVQRGYTFRHKVLRPVLVRVAVHPPAKSEPKAPEQPETGEPDSGKPKSRLDIN